MDDSLFNDSYIEHVVLPVYPNILKESRFDANSKLLCGPVIIEVDSGPGQKVANLNSISKRTLFREHVLLILLMSLPNATGVNQELDTLYGAFKSAAYPRGEVILMEHHMRLRRLERPAGCCCS
ncbi:hypothetical protein MHU86_20414 [Fragilaria crotonensis]|nr:hypothetical protein MHU86_20414 [Fragilaria crotonensis]